MDEQYDYYASGDYDRDKEEARSEEEHALAEYEAEKAEGPQAYCQVCGRPLSDPASVAMGMGPICAGKQGRWVAGVKAGRHDSIGDLYLDEPPLTQELVVQRMETPGRVATNVPHRHVHHSPSGFEYGYGGSGPADLALNLAAFVVGGVMPSADTKAVKLWDGTTCSYEAWAIHHDLKFGLIAAMKGDEDHKIPYGYILEKVKFLLRLHAKQIHEHKKGR